MKATVQKWGDGIALHIPDELAAELGITPGTDVEIERHTDGIVVRRAKGSTLQDMLKQIKPEHLHEETDWGNAEGNEVW